MTPIGHRHLEISPRVGLSLAAAGLLLGTGGCGPEGEGLVAPPSGDVCAAAQAVLADGVQDGDELVMAFDCLNRSGDYDALAPTVTALDETVDAQGSSLLDLWVVAINQQLTHGAGGPHTVALSPDDIAGAVAQLAGFMQSGAPEAALALTSEAIDARVAGDALWVLQRAARGAAALHDAESGPTLSQWLAALRDVVCHGDEPDACSSNLEDALRGMKSLAEPSTYDPEDPANDNLRRFLDWQLYAAGDVARAREAHEGLAAALGELAQVRDLPGAGGHRSILALLLQDVLPTLYGDDPATAYVYEGYPSLNPDESALYAVMLTLTDPSVQEGLSNSAPETWELVSSYYPLTRSGHGTPAAFRTETCLSPADAPATVGTANNGVDQLVRLLVAADVPWDETPAQCQAIFALGLPLLSPYFDMSGDKSISGLVLELFAQLPLPLIQVGADVFNVPQIVQISNALCGLNVQLDDTEALQRVVYMESTMQMSLPLLAAITRADAMPAVVDLLAAMWSSPALCQLGPTTRLLLDPDAPDPVGGSSLDLLPNPTAPRGTTGHDLVTMPLLATMMDVGRHADVLLAPLEVPVSDSDDALVRLLLDLGAMAHDPDSALGDAALVSAELSQLSLGTGEVDLGAAAGALEDDDLAYALLSTLAAPQVLEALAGPAEDASGGLLELLGDEIENGTLGGYLALLSVLLDELDGALSEGAAPRTEPDAFTQME